jgi:DNA-binding beta-propeller fold protein YncE
VIDAATNTVMGTIPLSDAPAAMAVSPIASMYDNTVSVVALT